MASWRPTPPLTPVNGLLDVAQMESAFGSLESSRAGVATLVDAAIGQVRDKAAARGRAIELACEPGTLQGDVEAARFQQAVRNVLANAVGGCRRAAASRCAASGAS